MGILSAFPGKSKPKLQSKTVTPTTSAQNVTADSQYDGLDKVTVNRIPTSYVLPSATQSATTWTPGISNQYIPAGTYLSGQQTIQGDVNLAAANIQKDVSVFGVTGTCPKGFMTVVAHNEITSNIDFSHPALDSLPDTIMICVTNRSVENGLQCASFVRTGNDNYIAAIIIDGDQINYEALGSISGNTMNLSTSVVGLFDKENYAITCQWGAPE